MLRLLLAISAALAAFGPALAARPALVVQITVDQLRGDMPDRVTRREGTERGGFEYFLDNGVVFTNAHYGHASTYTANGHAALFTGGDAAQHGFPGNYWRDRVSGEEVYCVADERFPVVGDESSGTGRSPKHLSSSTIGDELIINTSGKARVFSVSVKDRGAIIPAGRAGKAFWYSKRNGGFVSSSYYFEALPAWAQAWNDRSLADLYRNRQWKLLLDRDSYVSGAEDDRPWELSYGGLGRTFPHRTTRDDLQAHYRELRYTPFADELTLSFVKELLKKEKLGLTGSVDFLAIGFSATDYIGHAFGPNSLEAEDNLLRLDRTLAQLLSSLDKHIGLENVLLVLSSDHGVDAAPEYKKSLGFEAGRIDPAAVTVELERALQTRYSSKQSFVAGVSVPGVYLRANAAAGVEVSAAELEEAAAQALLTMPGIAMAVTRSGLMSNDLPRTPLHAMVRRAFHPRRSGDVVIVQEQSWFLSPGVDEDSATHGSPYSYDTHVPIVFAHTGLSPRRVSRRVGPESVAPTLAAILGIPAPTGSSRELLREVFPP